MKRYRFQFKRIHSPKKLTRETVHSLAVICFRYRNELSEDFLGPVDALLLRFDNPMHIVAEPDCLFVYFTEFSYPEWEKQGKVFYEYAMNKVRAEMAGIGFATGKELLYPVENVRLPHEFPDGAVCREAYKNSFGESFSKF